jgi:RimJ/RimL family protein N-acetyltransferase
VINPSAPIGLRSIVVEPTVLTIPPTASMGELTLRPWCAEDLDAVIEAYRDPVLRRWTGLPVTDRAEARRWLDVQHEGWRSAERLSFAVDEKSAATGESQLVANVALKLTRREHGDAEVGYWTAVSGRRRGIASRALDTLSTWTFATFAAEGVARLVALHDVRNGASCRVAEKAGYRFVGVLSAPAPSTDRGHLHVRISRGDASMDVQQASAADQFRS